MRFVRIMRGKNPFEHGICSCDVSCDDKYFNYFRMLSVISAGNAETWVFYKQWETENYSKTTQDSGIPWEFWKLPLTSLYLQHIPHSSIEFLHSPWTKTDKNTHTGSGYHPNKVVSLSVKHTVSICLKMHFCNTLFSFIFSTDV